jgi:glycosyltransferase involved in cell wall biosynthesis
MPSQHITFVIATYKRAEALRCTLQSVILQQYQDWTTLVIGDCCGDETADVIRSLGETRIKYYNFPERFGEQSGPNSFGLHLAKGDFISFLNHDDLLLSDHLDYALDQITARDADFHIGLCANATELNFEDNGSVIPVFTTILPRYRDLSFLILSDPWIFDPSSFWLIRTSYARAVGPWKPSVSLWRTPLRDWIMRAWRLGGKFSFSDKVTGLRFWTQNLREGAPLYTNTTPEHDYMIRRIQTESQEVIRQFIHDQIEEACKASALEQKETQQANSPFLNIHWDEYQRRILARFFLWLGLDTLNFKSQLLGQPKGVLHKNLLQRRTGENLPQIQNISDRLINPEAYRVF